MARGPQKQASQLFDQSQAVGKEAGGNASTLFNSLFPIYSSEATNPEGFSAPDMADMNTAGQQSTGGALSSAVGRGDLMAARTRNVGGFQASGDESARDAMRTNSQNAVGIKSENARLKEAKRQAGIAGLAGLHGSSVNELLGSMGLGNEAINTELKAGQSGWLQNFMNIIQTLSGSAGGAGQLMAGAHAAGVL